MKSVNIEEWVVLTDLQAFEMRSERFSISVT